MKIIKSTKNENRYFVETIPFIVEGDLIRCEIFPIDHQIKSIKEKEEFLREYLGNGGR